jgi:hypothetical protein
VRTLAVARLERHDGNNVGGTDARMRSLVTTKVDSLTRGRNTGQQRLD